MSHSLREQNGSSTTPQQLFSTTQENITTLSIWHFKLTRVSFQFLVDFKLLFSLHKVSSYAIEGKIVCETQHFDGWSITSVFELIVSIWLVWSNKNWCVSAYENTAQLSSLDSIEKSQYTLLLIFNSLKKVLSTNILLCFQMWI